MCKVSTLYSVMVLLLMACAMSGELGEKVSLRMNFKQGRECIVHIKSNIVGQMQLTFNGAGKRIIESDIFMDASGDFVETVKMVGVDGDGLIELRVKELKFDGVLFGQKASLIVKGERIIFNMGELEVDTDALPEEQRKRIHRLLFGPAMLSMQPHGKVTSSIGFERLQFVAPNFDPQQFFADLPPLLPEEPVGVGEEWERKVKIPTMLVEQPIPVNLCFKLESVSIDEATKHPVAAVSARAKVEIQDIETLAQIPQLKKPVKVRIESGLLVLKGEWQFDIAEGMPVQAEFKFDIGFKQATEVPKELLREEGIIGKDEKIGKADSVPLSVDVKAYGSVEVYWEVKRGN